MSWKNEYFIANTSQYSHNQMRAHTHTSAHTIWCQSSLAYTRARFQVQVVPARCLFAAAATAALSNKYSRFSLHLSFAVSQLNSRSSIQLKHLIYAYSVYGSRRLRLNFFSFSLLSHSVRNKFELKWKHRARYFSIFCAALVIGEREKQRQQQNHHRQNELGAHECVSWLFFFFITSFCRLPLLTLYFPLYVWTLNLDKIEKRHTLLLLLLLLLVWKSVFVSMQMPSVRYVRMNIADRRPLYSTEPQ